MKPLTLVIALAYALLAITCATAWRNASQRPIIDCAGNSHFSCTLRNAIAYASGETK